MTDLLRYRGTSQVVTFSYLGKTMTFDRPNLEKAISNIKVNRHTCGTREAYDKALDMYEGALAFMIMHEKEMQHGNGESTKTGG